MLFVNELAYLQTEITTFEAIIIAKRQQIEQFNQAQVVASRALDAVQNALANIEQLAPLALATLKSSVLSLFSDGSTDGNGDFEPEPTPEPQPGLNGESCEINPDVHWAKAQPDGSSWATISRDIADSPLQHAFLQEPTDTLNEGCPLYPRIHLGELASPIACRIVDAPTEKPSVPSVEVISQSEFIELVLLNENVAYQRRYDGEIIAVYAGGSNKQKLRDWGDWLTRTNSVTNGYELRQGLRLSTKWELKLTTMTLNQIERLAECDFSLDPRKCYPDAPKRQPERVPSMLEIEGIGVGSHVRSVTVKHWEYLVLAVRQDGLLDCERLNVNPSIKVAMHPSSVELIAKTASDAVETVSASAEPLEQKSIVAIASSLQAPRSEHSALLKRRGTTTPIDDQRQLAGVSAIGELEF